MKKIIFYSSNFKLLEMLIYMHYPGERGATFNKILMEFVYFEALQDELQVKPFKDYS